jgi:predicted outer membrane protein
MRTLWVLVLVIVATTVGCGRRRGTQPTLTGSGEHAATDTEGTPAARAALARLHEHNRTEIAIAGIGRDRAQSPAVQEYAGRLRADSAVADAKVARYADDHGIEVPTRPPVHGRQAYGAGQPGGEPSPKRVAHSPEQKIERVRELRGDDFDRQFLILSLQDHAEQQRALEATQRPEDAQLRALIDEGVATMRAHQATARQLLSAPAPAAQGRRPR